MHIFGESEPGRFVVQGQKKEGKTECGWAVKVTVGDILLPWMTVRAVVKSFPVFWSGARGERSSISRLSRELPGLKSARQRVPAVSIHLGKCSSFLQKAATRFLPGLLGPLFSHQQSWGLFLVMDS